MEGTEDRSDWKTERKGKEGELTGETAKVVEKEETKKAKL
jgi:hypothetical protein